MLKKILQILFSVKNSKDKCHKIVTILGFKIKFRCKSDKYELNKVQETLTHLQNIERKLSMPNDIWQTKNAKFYLPYYPIDFIQRHIVNTNSFFEEDILQNLDKYIPEGAVILDIGANIGNHCLYWGIQKKVNKVYAFEPVVDTFEILKKNIELNNLKDKIVPYNFGLSDKNTNATYLTYRRENIGDTHLIAGEGDMILKKLDNINIEESHIDFIKIDVEDMEIYAINGAKETFRKYKPLFIFIEVSKDEKLDTVVLIMNKLGYIKIIDYPHRNYLFKYKKESNSNEREN